MLKKSIFVSVLVCGSASAMAQAPVGPGMIPSGGGGSLMQPPVVRSRTALTLDTRPLADASTPGACACAEFEIDEFLAASAQVVATPTSLPGLGEQTAAFLQSQGGDSGGAPSVPGEGEGGGSESPLNGEAPDPGAALAGGGLAAAPGEESGEDDDSGAQSFSASLPADVEEDSPVPQPFQLSSIVNVDVAASARNPSESGADSSSGQSEGEASQDEAAESDGAESAEDESESL